MGAAFLAGLATGFWNSTDELQSIVKLGKRFEPTMGAPDREPPLRRLAASRSRHPTCTSTPPSKPDSCLTHDLIAPSLDLV